MQDSKIIKRFEKDFESMNNYWEPLHKKHRETIKFVWFNEQWDSAALQERSKGKTNNGDPLPPRPTLVFNLVKAFIIKVVNGIKKMKPSLVVSPVDGNSDKVLADVRRGLIQSIERNTGAIPARLNALNDAVSAGYGFYRYIVDWCDPMSEYQEFKYMLVEDATCVLYDEGSKELDGSDCKKAIIQEKLTKSEFKSRFGKKWEDVYQEGHIAGTNLSKAWGNAESPSISEYFFVDEQKEKLVKLTPEFGNTTAYYSEVQKQAEELGINVDYMLQQTQEGKIWSRPTTSRKVWWVKLCGNKVLEKQEWLGYWIPVFKVEGRTKKSQGQVIRSGLADDAKGPQKSYNYARNAQLERLSLTTKSPYVAPIGSIPEGEKYKWTTANTRNWAVLGFNAYDKNQNPLPQPQRTPSVQVDPGLAVESQTSQDEIKSTMGLYGSYIGDTQDEKSGRAILAGAEESADTVYDFANNLAETMGYEGKTINEMIPKVFSMPQQVRMMGEDETEKVVWINQQAQDENGSEYYYDMNQGKFDLHVEMGPSDATKRMETRDSMEVYMKALPPEFSAIFADLYAKEQDWRKSDQIAERTKKFIKAQFPGIIDDEDDDEEPPPELIEAQQVIDDMNAQLQQLAMENEEMKSDKRLDARRVQIEEFRAKTERLKAIVDAQTDQAKMEADLEKAGLDAEHKMMQMEREADKNEVTEYFESLSEQLQGQIDALQGELKEVSAKEKPAEPVKLPEPPPINVTVNMPKGGGKKKITGPGGKEYTVESAEGEDDGK